MIEPILAIGDPRTDKRIDFIGGIRGLEALQQKVDSGEMKVAFSMYPTSMEELMSWLTTSFLFIRYDIKFFTYFL